MALAFALREPVAHAGIARRVRRHDRNPVGGEPHADGLAQAARAARDEGKSLGAAHEEVLSLEKGLKALGAPCTYRLGVRHGFPTPPRKRRPRAVGARGTSWATASPCRDRALATGELR